jgi:hypothetical protein
MMPTEKKKGVKLCQIEKAMREDLLDLLIIQRKIKQVNAPADWNSNIMELFSEVNEFVKKYKPAGVSIRIGAGGSPDISFTL